MYVFVFQVCGCFKGSDVLEWVELFVRLCILFCFVFEVHEVLKGFELLNIRHLNASK